MVIGGTEESSGDTHRSSGETHHLSGELWCWMLDATTSGETRNPQRESHRSSGETPRSSGETPVKQACLQFRQDSLSSDAMLALP